MFIIYIKSDHNEFAHIIKKKSVNYIWFANLSIWGRSKEFRTQNKVKFLRFKINPRKTACYAPVIAVTLQD